MKRLWFLGESAVLFGADQLMKTYVEQNFDRGEEKKLTDRIARRGCPSRGRDVPGTIIHSARALATR